MLFCGICGKFIWRASPHCPYCQGARYFFPRLLFLLMLGLLVVGYVAL